MYLKTLLIQRKFGDPDASLFEPIVALIYSLMQYYIDENERL